MAKLLSTSLVLAEQKPGEDFMDFMRREQAALDALETKQTVLQFPIADGYALYAVVKESPLTIQHIRFGDAWQIPYAHVRGLTLADVKQQVASRKAMAALFAK